MDLTIGKLKNTQSLLSQITLLAPNTGNRVPAAVDSTAGRRYAGIGSLGQRPALPLVAGDTEGTTHAIVDGTGQYLFTEVNTATPQKLQLLLIEAALRSANRARQFWQQGRDDRAVQVAGCTPRDWWPKCLPASIAKPAAIWRRAFRRSTSSSFARLVKAGHRRDEKSLGDAIRILEIERETWRQLCDKLAVNAGHHVPMVNASFGDPPQGVLPPPSSDLDPLSQPGAFSLEA